MRGASPTGGSPDVRWPSGLVVRVCRRILAAGARRVTVYRRREWLAEWEGELWALQRAGARRRTLLRFALDGYGASLWERRQEEGLLGGVTQDVRNALRRLGRSPVSTFVIVIVLALGIGANTTLFGALGAALLEQSPYPESERLVSVDLLLQVRPDAPADTFTWSYPKYVHARQAMTTVESLAAYGTRTATLTGAGDPVRLGVEYVTPVYFELLGVRAIAGRVFGAGEEYPAANASVLLGHDLWRTRFGGDASVVGRTVQVDGTVFDVAGVLPAGFRGISGSGELFLPVAGLAQIRGARRVENAWSHWLNALGRLRPGVTIEQARSEAARVGVEITRLWPDPSGTRDTRHGMTMVPFLNARVNPVARLAVTAVSVGALLLLLITCANVAGLMLARSAARRTDTAVRAALGAGRSRLIRESLLESMLLAVAAGGMGLLLAFAGQRVVAWAVRYALDTNGSRSLQFLDANALAVDGGVLAAGVVLALLTGLLFGVLPARAASRPDLNADLRGGARTTWSGGRRGPGTTGRAFLVAGQLALTLVLLAGAGLVGASFAQLSAIDTGFANTRVLTARFERAASPSPAQDRLFDEQLTERVAALPGVLDVAMGNCPPLTSMCEILGVRQIDDRPPPGSGLQSALTYAVSTDYFATLGIRLQSGRTFTAADGPAVTPVAVISETAARDWFPGESAIGHRVAVTHSLTETAKAEIIGVVDDVRYAALERPAIPAVYLSRAQAPTSYGTIFIHSAADPLAVLDGVRQVVGAIDDGLPLYDISTMAERIAIATARTRVVLGLLTAFALTGLLLAMVGLYGVVAYTIEQRTRELGIRFALGASRADVLRLVVTPPALLALAGTSLGVGAALFLTRFARALLYGIEPSDPRVMVGAVVVLLGVAALAAWIPARRAAIVHPANALR